MDDWRELDPDVVAGMFDARLKSVIVASHPRMMNVDDMYELNRGTGHHLSEIELSEPGVRLLLGRNGSGKSTLLEQLGRGISEFRSDLEVSWIFSLPSEQTLESWSALVDELFEDPGFLDEEIEELRWDETARLTKLPLLQILLDSIKGADEGEARVDVLETLGFTGFTSTPSTGRATFGIGDGEYSFTAGPPTSYSPRHHAALWIWAALRTGSSRLYRDGDDQIMNHPITGWSYINSDFYLRDTQRSLMCRQAMEQFMASVDEVEIRFVREKPEFRFLAPPPESGPLSELLAERRHLQEAVDAQVLNLSFPLDLLSEAADNRVGSTWFDFGISASHNQLSRITGVKSTFRDLLVCTTIDLRSDGESQIVGIWNRVVDRHLKVIVVRPVEQCESSTELPAPEWEHLVVSGYDTLDTFLSEVADDLRELEIGMSGLRAARAPRYWERVSTKPGGRFGDLGEVAAHSLGRDWLDGLRLEWQSSISGEWLDFSSASQGQRDILLMLLAMYSNAASPTKKPSEHLLLIDEFDQHLHQSVTSKFLEIAQRRALQSGTRAILSTHSAPILAHPSTRQAPRIFARRTLDGAFSYSQRPPETREQLAAELGVDLLAASALSRMFVMVEGEHDEVVLRSLLSTGRGGEEITGVELINARGTWAFEGIWNNVLRYHTAPVLVVHDKLDRRFERAWAELKERAGRDGETMPRWVETDFHRMRAEIDDRSMNKKSRRGDDETDKMLEVVFSIFGGREGRPSAKDVLRLTFHGIESPDIIRLLPIDHFLDARRHGSWEAAEEWWGRQGKGNSWNKEFKKSLKLTTDAVRTTLSKTQDGWHPELQRLYDVMSNLYHVGGPEE